MNSTRTMKRISIKKLLCSERHEDVTKSSHSVHSQLTIDLRNSRSQETLSISDSEISREKAKSTTRGRRRWTAEEDQILKTVTADNAGKLKWIKISESLPGRTGKQCSERWLNHLRPHLRKSNWSPWEDCIILREQSIRGNRWVEIARMLPGRSGNAVKNRFNSTLQRLYL